jgi:16S rRNA A1518/A1519 N6-dimethyltransferase RsmA/KsgA/DIM1 with predicted DNA glycosylase/AP lyase activity
MIDFHDFHSNHYLRMNQRRLEHLASLGLPLSGRTVLELGAGIGDLSTFFLDRAAPLLADSLPDHQTRC